VYHRDFDYLLAQGFVLMNSCFDRVLLLSRMRTTRLESKRPKFVVNQIQEEPWFTTIQLKHNYVLVVSWILMKGTNQIYFDLIISSIRIIIILSNCIV